MSFSRTFPELLTGDALDAAIRGIGLRLGATNAGANVHADIELTLVSAVEASLPTGYRTLGVVTAWLEVHHAHVNVPRLLRLVDGGELPPVARAYWAAIGAWLGQRDKRWQTLARVYSGPRVTLEDPEITAMQIDRLGEDPRFTGTPLRVHAKLLRSRGADVDTPTQLATRHPGYLRRVQFGANHRADVWTALEVDPEATPAEVARRVGCAYETARSVAQDFHMVSDVARARFPATPLAGIPRK